MFFLFRRRARQAKPAHRTPSFNRPRVRSLEDRCLLSAAMPLTLDTSFGGGAGYVSTNPGGATTAGIALQSNGQIVGVGHVSVTSRNGASESSIAVFRYNADGSVDTSFGSRGLTTTTLGKYGAWGNAVAIDSQGRILVAGMEQLSSTPGTLGYNVAWVVARYNANGTLDTTFGSKGIVTTDFVQGNNEPSAIAIEPWDGKILVAGSSGQTSGTRFSVARYTTTGALDSTFGSSGIFVLNPGPAPSDAAANFAFGPNQRIVLAGHAGVTSSVQYGQDGFLIVALNGSNGTLDTTFNGTGYVVSVPPAANSSLVDNGGDASSVVIQPDGSIMACGDLLGHTLNVDSVHTVGTAVVRYTSSGALDSSFGNNAGWATLTQIYGGNAITIEPGSNGEFNVTGYVPVGSTSNAAIARLLPSGALDTNFGSDGGYSTLAVSGASYGPMAIQGDGEIVVAGTPALARYFGASPTIGWFTASQAAAGSPVTLTASNISDGNPSSTISQVTFFYYDSSGNKIVVGTATASDGSGNWTVSASLPPGSYTLYAQATDSDGVLGDPLAYSLTVQ